MTYFSFYFVCFENCEGLSRCYHVRRFWWRKWRKLITNKIRFYNKQNTFFPFVFDYFVIMMQRSEEIFSWSFEELHSLFYFLFFCIFAFFDFLIFDFTYWSKILKETQKCYWINHFVDALLICETIFRIQFASLQKQNRAKPKSISIKENKGHTKKKKKNNLKKKNLKAVREKYWNNDHWFRFVLFIGNHSNKL